MLNCSYGGLFVIARSVCIQDLGFLKDKGSHFPVSAPEHSKTGCYGSFGQSTPISCLSIPESKVDAPHGEKSLALEFASLVTFALAAKRRMIHASVRSHVRLIPECPATPRRLEQGDRRNHTSTQPISPPILQFGRYSAQPITSPTLIWFVTP
jgi:hypothetical protein